MLEVFRRLGSIQFDPIAIAGRTHDLVLHARVADYDPAWCDLLYERREIFEAHNKGLSFVPASEFPWFRGTWRQTGARVLAENAEVAEQRARADPRRGAAVGARLRARATGQTTDWFGIPTNTVRAVLEAYSVTGVLGLARRDGNRRYYDLLERLLPADLLAREIPLEEQTPPQAPLAVPRPRPPRRGGRRRHLRGHRPGQAGSEDSRTTPAERLCASELVADGELVPVEVEGVRGKRFVLAEDVELLERPPEPPPSVAFLPPFDPLVWDRPLLGSLFDFDYVWELFHPPAKRRWGWYVLPLLFRDRFVGRIEPRIDRAGGQVQVLDLWWEDGFSPRRTEGFVDAMRDALRAYLRFGGATRLEWAPHLARERRLFLTRP